MGDCAPARPWPFRFFSPGERKTEWYQQKGAVAVYNAIGQVVYSYKNNSPQLVIDLRMVDAGVYVVCITGETGQRSSTVRMMKR